MIVFAGIGRKEIRSVSMSLVLVDASHYAQIRLTAESITVVRGFSLQRHRISKAEDLEIFCVETRPIHITILAHNASQSTMMVIHLAGPVSFPTSFKTSRCIRVPSNLSPFAI